MLPAEVVHRLPDDMLGISQVCIRLGIVEDGRPLERILVVDLDINSIIEELVLGPIDTEAQTAGDVLRHRLSAGNDASPIGVDPDGVFRKVSPPTVDSDVIARGEDLVMDVDERVAVEIRRQFEVGFDVHCDIHINR